MVYWKFSLLFLLLGFVMPVCGQTTGGNYNPFVAEGRVSPSPIPPIEFGGKGELIFKVGNTGNDALEYAGDPSGDLVVLVVNLALGVPDVEPLTAESAIQAIGGEYSSYFSWSYDVTTNTFKGRQKATLPAFGIGLVTIGFRVTKNSASTQVGFAVTLMPPAYTQLSNSINDDKVSSYTWTEYRDYGDAPASYGIVYHKVQEDPAFRVFLGAWVDGESASRFSSGADGDDFDGVDDEDGVSLPVFLRGTTVSVPVTVKMQGYLNGWIDWNQDGDFLDTGEKVVSDRLITPSGATIEVAVPSGTPLMMDSYARFRFGVKGLGPSGSATTGEVEDYMVHIMPSAPSIMGNVYLDDDRMSDNLVDGTGTNAGGSLFVNLLDPDSIVISSVQVSEDGAFFFADLPGEEYLTQLTIYEGVPGTHCPETLLSKDIQYVAEKSGDGPGCDGSPDGFLKVLFDASQTISSVYFGIALLPDVTVNITATPNVMGGLTHFNVVVRVTELNQVATSGPVTLIIPRDTRWSLEERFDTSLTQLDQVLLQNSMWSFSESDPGYYIFTMEEVIPAGESVALGFKALFNPNNTRGVYSITAQILSGSGGEYLMINNSDSEKLEYFPR